MTDLFNALADVELPEELRQELMSLATSLRTTAAKIDEMVKARKKTDLDENNEPTFRFRAKVVIPTNFYLTKRLADYGMKYLKSEDRVKSNFDAFIRFYAKTGRKWQDWSRVWYDWVRREADKSPAKAKTSDSLGRW